MSEKNEGQSITKSHLLRKYKEKRGRVENLMRTRQSGQDEKSFQSSVSIATAEAFRESLKSNIDDLTGLIKKPEFLSRLNSTMDSLKRNGGKLSVYTLDLDGFKALNDTYGHQQGDEVLKFISELLQKTMRSYDIVGRLGGDEFGIIEINSDTENSETIAERLDQALKQNIGEINGLELLAGSIGFATYSQTEENISAEELLRRSDIAMYNAKLLPGTHIIPWKPEMVIPSGSTSRI